MFIKFIIKEKFMISVIGAGPIGSYAAYLLAKKGRDVNVYEEHRQIGNPVQCAGILPSTISKFIGMDNDFVLNTPDRIKIHSSNDSVEIELKKENYVIDREMFDNYLAEKSMDVGVKYFLGWKFEDFYNKELLFNNGKARTDIVIGADGPCSMVAHKSGLYYGRNFDIGMQTSVNMSNEEDLVQTYVGDGYFGWVIPEDNKRARVGIVAKNNCKQYFDLFLKKLNISAGETFSGLIPIYNPNVKISNGSYYLVGDAAMQVKATTCGGIVHGFFGAQELSKAILNRENYDELCREGFGKDLKYALAIRNKLNKMSDMDYDYLIKLVKQTRIKNVLSRHERDYTFKILFNVLIREPRFLKFLFV